MVKGDMVYLYVWTGNAEIARNLVGSRFPGSEVREFSHSKFRSSNFGQRLRTLHSFQGKALIFHFQSLADCKYNQILKCIHLLHRCHETVLADEEGAWETIRQSTVLRLVPAILFRALLDVKTLIFWWCYLHYRLNRAAPLNFQTVAGDPDVAYLIPNSKSMGDSGGAVSHIRGFLGGLKAMGKSCRVFCGAPLAQEVFPNEIIGGQSGRFLFWEAPALAYNFVFARGVQKHLADRRPRFLYQRHCRFSIAGALLSMRLRIPLILEYNGSEVWIAHHWDPTPFGRWVRLCEEVTIRFASRIIVVSDALKTELTSRGISRDRILVNPNAVDPDYFYPGTRKRKGAPRSLALNRVRYWLDS